MSDDNIKILSISSEVDDTLDFIKHLISDLKFTKEIKNKISSKYTEFLIAAALENTLRDIAGQSPAHDHTTVKQDTEDLLRYILVGLSDLPSIGESEGGEKILADTMSSLQTKITELASSFDVINRSGVRNLLLKRKALELRISEAPDRLNKLHSEKAALAGAINSIDFKLSTIQPTPATVDEYNNLVSKRGVILKKYNTVDDLIQAHPARLETTLNALSDVNQSISTQGNQDESESCLLNKIEDAIDKGISRLEIDNILTYDVMKLPRALVLTRYNVPYFGEETLDSLNDKYDRLVKFIKNNKGKFSNYAGIVLTSSENISSELAILNSLERSCDQGPEDFEDSLSHVKSMITQLSSLVGYNAT